MKKIDMEIVDIALSGSSSGAYAMVLGEVGGSRKLPIVIGGSEAQAIAIEMEKMKASRPLTHDLFRNAFEVFGLTVTEVLIYNMVEGIFYAKLICSDGVREEEVDARPSDGVALAYRFNAPIRCYDSVLDAAGIRTEDLERDDDEFEGEDEEEAPRTQVAHVGSDDRSLEELEEELQNAIEREDYERASRLRDEIERRKGG
jgi:bifunctional DNase/RNase